MTVQIIVGDALDQLRLMPARSVHCCLTSPPYFRLRDYDHPQQIGRESTVEAYLDRLAEVFAEVRRVLRSDGSLWLSIGDSYAAGGNGGGGKRVAERRQWTGAHERKGWRAPPPGYKDRSLLLIPHLLANRLRIDGWILRRDIVWNKIEPIETPRRDRPSTTHEFIFLFAKSRASSVRSPGEPWFKSSVWSVRPQPRPGRQHSAIMESEIARRCIVSGTKPGDTVLDPFGGDGTTGLVADRLQRHALLIELHPEYASAASRRIKDDRGGLLEQIEPSPSLAGPPQLDLVETAA